MCSPAGFLRISGAFSQRRGEGRLSLPGVLRVFIIVECDTNYGENALGSNVSIPLAKPIYAP
jgi:hypothetical protein